MAMMVQRQHHQNTLHHSAQHHLSTHSATMNGREGDEEDDEILYRRQSPSEINNNRSEEQMNGDDTEGERQQGACCSYHNQGGPCLSPGLHRTLEATRTPSEPCPQTSDAQQPQPQQQCNGVNTDGETQQQQQQSAPDESNALLRDEYVDKVWDEFVTDFLLGSRNIQKAAIFDLATKRPLAANGDLHVRPEEIEQLVAGLHNLRLAYRNGVTLNGKKYKVHLADGRNGILARTNGEGCTVCKTHTLVIIGYHDDRGNSRKCNEDVMRLGDFFRRKAV